MNGIQIVITHYNKGTLLKRALDSLSLPGNDGFSRLIAVDDASSDPGSRATWREMKEKYAGDPRFIFLEQRFNGGSSAALNTAIRLCSDGIIMQLDADDRLPEGAIAAVAAAAAAHPEADLFVGDYWKDGVLVSNRCLFPEVNGPLKRRRLAAGYTLPGVTPYTLKLWRLAGGYDERVRMLNDMDFFLRAMEKGEFSGCYVPVPIYEWHLSDGGKSTVCRRSEIAAMFFRHWRFYRANLPFPDLCRETARHLLAWGLDSVGVYPLLTKLRRRRRS